MDLSNFIRPQVRGFEPYLPGRSIDSVKREYKLSHIIKLASNENPLGPSPKALAAIRLAGKKLFLYPDGASTALREAIAKAHQVARDRVIVGAGSDELIELLGKTFLNPGDSIVVSEHAFIRYEMAAEMMGASVIRIAMRGYTHDLSAMAAAIQENTKIVFIANPNNPTGTYNTRAELTGLLERVAQINASRSRPVLVVVDEAYYEFARAFAKDYPETIRMQKTYENLVVLRTFSKVHALAGLRVGYGFAAPSVIQALDRVRPPFNVSTLGQLGAAASLKDTSRIANAIRHVTAERKTMLSRLATLGLPSVPTVGNFVLIDVAPRGGKEMFDLLLRRGIIVRSMDEYGYPKHIRVTYGLPTENRVFLQALKEILKR
jgi:histidinol-phosphate aminotransferase